MIYSFYNFTERLNFSEGIELEEDLLKYLLKNIPNATDIQRAEKEDDKTGIDYWIFRKNLPPLAIDVKHRSFCPIQRWGKDDACIETTSVYTGNPFPPWDDQYRLKPGWTLDENKRTDIVIYTWPYNETLRRYWIVYFPLLCRAAKLNWRRWAEEYGEIATHNDLYLTLNIYVPRIEIVKAINQISEFVALK